jgi:VCBS repeat-containing protein
VSQINDAPSGVEDFISVTNGGTVNVLNDGITNSVLSNDDDPEGDAIIAIEVLSPINGTLNLSTDGTFTYTHDGSATTTDVFTYTPRDNFSTGNTTTVTIYINNLPIGVSESIALFESGTATITTAASTSVLSNDTDTDVGDQALLTALIETSPVNGTLTLNSNGTFTYIHNGSENFTDSFTYIPFDGKGYGTAVLVSITVTPTNDPPVAYPDNITIGLGGTATILTNGGNSVLLNDLDSDGDVLTVTVVSTPTYGTLVLNPGGTFSYVQNGVMNGGDSFTYKANDGLLDSNTVSVNIDLTCTPCTQSTIIGGSDGALFRYQGCDCRNYSVYVPKGKSYTFCHLDNSISILQGAYTVLSTEVCQ